MIKTLDDLKNKGIELNNTYNCDCLEAMRYIKDKGVDLVLTDPPYGINADKGTGGFGSSKHTIKKYNDTWDSKSPDKIYFDEMLRVGKTVMIFGGNYFTDKLPISRGWIVWDKVGEMKFNNPYSQCELIWTNKDMVCKKYIIIQMGFVSKEKERFHPTQKPIDLLGQIIRDYTTEKDIILDCYLGSGSTAIACENLKRNWIGIEISPEYCKIAEKRIKKERDQLRLI